MKNVKSASATRPRAWFAPLLLLLVLTVLFWRSFLPGIVHFSNDGPLGMQNAAWLHLPEAIGGQWLDLNSIGSNGGQSSPDILTLIRWVLQPVGYAKFLAPVALWILGVGAWFFFRQLKFSPLAAVLGGLAAAMNSTFFSTACWGVAAQQIAIGMDFFALGLIVSNAAETPALTRWLRLALAGLCVGVNVMEAADIGAIFSLFIAAFVFYKTFVEDFIPLLKIERIIVLCCVNGSFLLLFALGIIFGLGIFKLCLLLVLLIIAAVALNWSLIRKPVPLTRTERIVTLGLMDLAFLFLLVFAVLHGFGFLFLALLFIVGVVLNWALLCYPLFVNRSGLAIIRLAVVAIFAGFIATQTVASLIGSAVTGIAGTAQDQETKAGHWDWATQWSLPKAETLGVFVPGLFGYKMDTPNNMMPALQESYKNGQYWGGVGRDPAIDRYFDSGRQGTAPASGFMRFIGGGTYVGILVALLAAWAIAQSLRRENSVFTIGQKRFIWFWTAALALSLPLAWGRFAPFSKEYDSLGFYALLYHLPYFSTIRNPVKFILVFSWVIVILFGYGVHALSRRYLEVPASGSSSPMDQLTNWWAKIKGFDRNWTIGCGAAVICSVLGWLIYSAQTPALVKYLQLVGFPDEGSAKAIAAFSSGQVVWFIFYLVATVLLCTLVMAGVFAGKRAKLGGVLLGALLLLDLGRANLPWIIHWDYAQKYASNPIVDFLKERPYENRVATLPFRSPEQFQLFDQLYRIEWAQHHFPYYNIQSLDIIQMSRMPADLAAFEGALQFRNSEDSSYLIPRRWQLTNTRYLLGPAGFLDVMNGQLDSGQQRFRILQRFDVAPKPGIEKPVRLEELTAVTSDNGAYALFEFTGALPRAKLYSHWQVSTNDEATLKMLGDKNFDPQQTVLVATSLPTAPSTNQISGLAEFKSYKPGDIVFATKSEIPSVLLLNDRYDANWRVQVDGKPAELLRCNYIMRGVYLPAGPHTVEFQFRLPNGPLKITLAAIAAGVVLLGLLIFLGRRRPADQP